MNAPRDDKHREAFPGPREVRYLLELTGAYAKGLRDALAVIESALAEAQLGGDQYGPLLEQLRRLLAKDGPLAGTEAECRLLLGLA